jgi:hypothetical protein
MSKGFAPASAQQVNRPKTLEAIALSQRLKHKDKNNCQAVCEDLSSPTGASWVSLGNYFRLPTQRLFCLASRPTGGTDSLASTE